MEEKQKARHEEGAPRPQHRPAFTSPEALNLTLLGFYGGVMTHTYLIPPLAIAK